MASARKHVEEALTPGLTRQVWSGDYREVLPATLQDYELSAVLPAVFYMFRFGQRRGLGRFIETFGKEDGSAAERRRSVTVERVAEHLRKSDGLAGFDDDVSRAILGDLLLCFCLENAKRAEGRDQQVQRISPAHYMASWVDLPQSVANLRFVPDMIVAMLANQEGEQVAMNANGDRAWFPVCRPHGENMLLRPFSRGVKIRPGPLDNFASDQFDEDNADVGLDQLLTIRLATEFDSAPLGARGEPKISNQRPLAELAGRHFSEDIRRFLRAYSTEVPRHALVDMLESCIAIGMTTVLSHTTALLLEWAEGGCIPDRSKQEPAAVLIDCSNGVDRRIRSCAEQSMDDLTRRMERLPETLMVLRLLDYHAKHDRKILSSPRKPIATDWVNLLGDLLHERHPRAHLIHYSIDQDTSKLADELDVDYPEVAAALRNAEIQPNAAWRLAHGLTRLMGPALVHRHFSSFVDSSLMTDRPNGIAVKRKTSRGARSGRRRDVRSLTLTDPAIEYLAHVHLLPNGNSRAFASSHSESSSTR